MSFKKLISDLENIGIKKGDDVLIHMSYKSLGYVDGGIDTFLNSLKAVVGDRGTILFPTLSYRYVTSENPVFDARHTASCVGAVSNYFLKCEGVKRSFNPTHSVAAYGFRQNEYIAHHYLDDEPVGPNSPFSILPSFGGKVLMIGCGIKCNTSMHGVEEFAKVPYVLSDKKREYVLIDYDNKVTNKGYYYHDMVTGHKLAQRYDRLYDLMEYKKGNISEAESYLIDSAKMWEIASKKIKEDTYYFTDNIKGED